MVQSVNVVDNCRKISGWTGDWIGVVSEFAVGLATDLHEWLPKMSESVRDR